MGEVLDRIMEASRKGCIEGWDKIGRLLKEVAELSIKDMTAMLGDKAAGHGRIITESFLNEEHKFELDQSVIEGVQLAEILCLTDGTKMMFKDDDLIEEQMALVDYDLCRREPYWYTCMTLILYMFREGQKADPLFRQFWCISLGDIMDGLNALDLVRYPAEERKGKYCDDGEEEYYSIDLSEICGIELRGLPYGIDNDEDIYCGEEEKETFYVDLKRDFYKKAKYLEFDLNPDITIGETLEQARKVIWEGWRPSKSLYDFAARILSAYEIVNFLLIESFRFWDPEHFDMDVILEKYKKLSKEE